MSRHLKNGLDMDAPETWPEAYLKAYKEVQYAQSGRTCCVSRMVNDPPTMPHQQCRNGHDLPWYDANDPERGFFDCHDETGGRS